MIHTAERALPLRVVGSIGSSRTVGAVAAVLSQFLNRLGQTADGEDKAPVPNANRAILDHCGGASQGATGFQIGVKRNANDRSAGRVDRELTLVCRNLDIWTRILMMQMKKLDIATLERAAQS